MISVPKRSEARLVSLIQHVTEFLPFQRVRWQTTNQYCTVLVSPADFRVNLRICFRSPHKEQELQKERFHQCFMLLLCTVNRLMPLFGMTHVGTLALEVEAMVGLDFRAKNEPEGP
jgi:hypothetical protein